ncbi:uncharacterized protein H6S33_002770 [Morchella sextelata]|uniref:uncharacterized protein n=1 Tax=Morchella sextelata TaxID=1174677 RepID=UPI001D05358E|nr:uncharacterized protein H6S33_002770 [Morchella sextelata]KAH0607736.1 hypothetical protein H6S33_002770 [Morchella sextelata]
MASSSQYAGPLKIPLYAYRGLGQKTALSHTYEGILRRALDPQERYRRSHLFIHNIRFHDKTLTRRTA